MTTVRSPHVFLGVLVLIVYSLLLARFEGALCAKEPFPYYAETIHEAPLRSAPSTGGYVTAQLARGTRLEIHRHEPGGWCGVRPLESSFSWIPARAVQLKGELSEDLAAENEAVVVEDGVFAWVGSQTDRVDQPHWQVRLKKDEIVRVLGAERLASSSGGVVETWYRIEPPAGEFRWIHSGDIGRVHPGDTVRSRPENQKMTPDRQVRNAVYEAEIVPETEKGTSKAPSKMAPKMASKIPSLQSMNPPVKAPEMTPREFEVRFRELKIALERELSKPQETRNFSPLRRQAAEIAARGPTSLARGQARLILEQIEKWAPPLHTEPSVAPPPALIGSGLAVAAASHMRDAGARQANFVEPQQLPPDDGSARNVLNMLRGSPTPPNSDQSGPRYDASGWLQPLVVRQPNLPPFAITDDQGRVLEYVIAAPGLNLRRYAKQRVGLYGRRGVSRRYQVRVLMAQRVVVLD